MENDCRSIGFPLTRQDETPRNEERSEPVLASSHHTRHRGHLSPKRDMATLVFLSGVAVVIAAAGCPVVLSTLLTPDHTRPEHGPSRDPSISQL